jgi:methylmalonyl-CoA/ethylmalonyl-CoA epimerase
MAPFISSARANRAAGLVQKLHHIGFVVGSIAEAAPHFAKSVLATWDGRVIHDPVQMVYVTFFRPAEPTDPMIELVEPAGERSPVLSFLSRGGGLHHLCFEVASLDQQLQRSRAEGNVVVRRPVPARAFDGRCIAWVYTKGQLLLEYLEETLPA